MTTDDTTREAALSALLSATAPGGDATPAPVATGTEVYAGGDVARVLVSPAHLAYRHGTGDSSYLVYPVAEVGDTVLLSAAEAKRLDELEVTVEVGTDLEALVELREDGLATDEHLAGLSAADLIAYIGQHPDERERVRDLENARKQPRTTVLKATEPTPELDDVAAAEAAARAAGTPTEGTGTGDGDDDPDTLTE